MLEARLGRLIHHMALGGSSGVALLSGSLEAETETTVEASSVWGANKAYWDRFGTVEACTFQACSNAFSYIFYFETENAWGFGVLGFWGLRTVVHLVTCRTLL